MLKTFRDTRKGERPSKSFLERTPLSVCVSFVCVPVSVFVSTAVVSLDFLSCWSEQVFIGTGSLYPSESGFQSQERNLIDGTLVSEKVGGNGEDFPGGLGN